MVLLYPTGVLLGAPNPPVIERRGGALTFWPLTDGPADLWRGPFGDTVSGAGP